MDFELAIIGAGPAGYSAAIYAARSGIHTTIFEKGAGGGLALTSPRIENYAGFTTISGNDLMEKMRQHASQYVDMKLYEEVQHIEKHNRTFLVTTTKGTYSVGAVLLCTGTEYKKLNVPGESALHGKGVSYCATCDGFFFKGKKVAVVGGGNAAVIEAIFLKQIGCADVFLIHRRNQLRAEQAYVDTANEHHIHVLYSTIVEAIGGDENVRYLDLLNTAENKKSRLDVDGVFISIGETPQNTLAQQMGVALDGNGFIITDKQQRTNVKGVYAAGDITGGLRQIITACAEGAIAALQATEVLGKQYPY